MTSLPIALQLYTVRDEAEQDFVGTLRKVAALGYTAVELAGYGGLSAVALRTLLNELNLSAPSSHCIRYGVAADEQAQALTVAKEIGCEYAVIPWLGPQLLQGTPQAELVKGLTSLGQRAREAGLQLVYHNHDYSFHRLENGNLLLDELLNAIDPALLTLELDIYWAAYAGIDPVTFLHEHRGRIATLHLKDMSANREMAEVGDGTLDIAAVIAAGEEAGARVLVVEHDHPTIPSLESARRSLENLRTRIYPQG